jgi:Ca2+-binding EF-hand superfamily protein
MKTFLLTGALAAMTLPLVAASAQELPNRPIARAEVTAAAKAQFARIDANHDGVVTMAEFQAYRARQGAAAPDASPFSHVGSHWFEHCDTNGDGKVTLAEAEARPLQMFDMADLNHDGVVSTEEARVAMALSSFGK